jgi:BAR-like domain
VLTAAWRHVIHNLIEYFEEVESMQKTNSKAFLKLSKTLEVPFTKPDFAPDGVALIWQGILDKAVQMSTFHADEAAMVKSGVLRDLQRLRDDVKDHLKDLDKEGKKESRKVERSMDKSVFPPSPILPHLAAPFSFAHVLTTERSYAKSWKMDSPR